MGRKHWGKAKDKRYRKWARANRKKLMASRTPQELAFSRWLKGQEVKFREQYMIGPYFVDFYFPEWRGIVELDGSHHCEAFDGNRQQKLNRRGYSILRVWNRHARAAHFPTILQMSYATYAGSTRRFQAA